MARWTPPKEWEDLTPVVQDDGPQPVVPITYPAEFEGTMNYFRAIMKKGEKTQRALQITEKAIKLNAANYTVWYYRRLCLFSTGSDLEQELNFTAQKAKRSPKNYQLWHHRRLLLDRMGKDGTAQPKKELGHISDILKKDSKNYHAWAYRQWILKRFDLFDEELNFVDSLLDDDRGNNSAWNERYFVISQTTGFTAAIIDREITYAIDYINKALNNQSPWNYLYGLTKTQGCNTEHIQKMIHFAEACIQKDAKCSEPYCILVELYSEFKPANLKKAQEAASKLADELDTIRKQYWNFRIKQLESLFSV